jgi:hypothetical protein
MLFKSINQRVSMLAIFALLPAALVAAEIREPFEIEKEGTQLIGQVEKVARDIRQDADQLESVTRGGQVTQWSHADYLMQIKEQVNEGLQPALNRLTVIQEDLPAWQQDTVDQMLDSAKALAGNTNSAILRMNEIGRGNLPVIAGADYREFVSQINEHAEALVTTADAAGDYAEAHQNAVEAGLTVPKF